MSQPLTPIYRARRTHYEIDRCVPQLRAVEQGKIRFHALSRGHYPGVKMASSALPGLNSIGFWDAARPQDWGLDPHRNEGIEVTFLEAGNVALTVDDRRFDLHAGQFTVTRPWQLHKLGAPNLGPGRIHWIILDVGVRRPNQEWRWPGWVILTHRDRQELARLLRVTENPAWDASPELAAAFRGLAGCVMEWGQPHVESRMTALLNLLLIGVLDALTSQESTQNPELTSRRRTVELFLRDLANNRLSSSEPWSLQGMATQCGMGITAFSAYCRELVNSSGMEYLHQCRLDHAARQMLDHPDQPITAIAFECGFNSSQYFATAFRNRFKSTPRQYRRDAGILPAGRKT